VAQAQRVPAQTAPVKIPTKGLLSIGQVMAKLTPEFPDLTPSKLRFLEDQGLVTPERTPSGYRKFSGEDVNRLRLILTLQRDQYLPLKVIRKHLDDIASGKATALPTAQGLAAGSPVVKAKLTREELARSAGASLNLLQDAVSAGLLPAANTYSDEAVTVLSSLADLQRAGIEPRHLRTMSAAAEREYSLIERSLMPILHRQDVATKAKAKERANDIARQLDVVRGHMLRMVISKHQG